MTKLLNFMLVFILSLVNFVIMLLPLGIILFPLLYIFKVKAVLLGLDCAALLACLISGYMLLYLLFDFIFGFTVKHYVKNTIPYQQAGFLNGHAEIVTAFTYLKKRFNLPKAELYISHDMQVNAYAVGSFRKKAVIITLGLIHRMHNTSDTPEAYMNAVKGIMGHEMSHLINKDFLPGMLVYSNEVASRFISRIIRGIFRAIARIFWIIPYVGKHFSRLIMFLYSMVDVFIGGFYRIVFKPVYGFLYKAFSRSIEYRCDRDSAKVFGGAVMAHALSVLGKGAYFSIFSTHPATKNRINHVKSIHPKPGIITPNILGTLANIMAITGLVWITGYVSMHSHIGYVYHDIGFAVQNTIHRWMWFIGIK